MKENTQLAYLYGQRVTFQRVILLQKVGKWTRYYRQVQWIEFAFFRPKATGNTHQDVKYVPVF